MISSPEIKNYLYSRDYQLWLQQILEQLRSGDLANIDRENLIQEIEDLGNAEKHAISSYLMRLGEHLLKVAYWDSERENCLRGWRLEITNFRIQIQERLETSPSLKSFLEDNFAKQYKNGRKLFLQASSLDAGLIPEEPCFTLAQALDENWLP